MERVEQLFEWPFKRLQMHLGLNDHSAQFFLVCFVGGNYLRKIGAQAIVFDALLFTPTPAIVSLTLRVGDLVVELCKSFNNLEINLTQGT